MYFINDKLGTSIIQTLNYLWELVWKNFFWFHRYRTTDGYSSYGGRSYLKFVDEQTNREVMFRELEVLDHRAAARDRRTWSIAAGGDSPLARRAITPAT